jgi:hypothetical protein
VAELNEVPNGMTNVAMFVTVEYVPVIVDFAMAAVVAPVTTYGDDVTTVPPVADMRFEPAGYCVSLIDVNSVNTGCAVILTAVTVYVGPLHIVAVAVTFAADVIVMS